MVGQKEMNGYKTSRGGVLIPSHVQTGLLGKISDATDTATQKIADTLADGVGILQNIVNKYVP